ncbi:MAG: rod shape-determining protein MreC [Anaerolineae bacterium]|nr:MAG: rod shape-determining protein MreC [Anaerolineae bacterium]MCL4880049.1 rod shape-determining protein MreC [Anaerolineae bacterium]
MQSPRSFTVVMTLGLCIILILLSLVGTLAPAEGILRIPLTALEGIFGGATTDFTIFAEEMAEFRSLRLRNRELEKALAQYQSELADLRAFRSDYDRLVELSNYVGQKGSDWRYVTTDVIGRDVNGVVRTIHIAAGTRNGVQVGDPVVTELGLVGRVVDVSATGAEVLLITDVNSSVTARVQNETRESGLVRGSISGDLILDFVNINGQLAENQQVFTSGETQAFPPNILVGQISSVGISPNSLFKQATVQSLVDFENLDIVLVITNFEPVDLQIFEEPEQP